MQTITTETNLYTFDELTQTAKDKAALDTCEAFFVDDFNTFIRDELYTCFGDAGDPNNTEWQFSLNSCQGDGFNFYGRISIWALWQNLCNRVAKPAHMLPDSVDESAIVDFPRGARYDYSRWGQSDYFEILRDTLTDQGMSEATAGDLARDMCKAMDDTCAYMEHTGYEMIDSYWDPEQYADMLFYGDGTYFGMAWDCVPAGA